MCHILAQGKKIPSNLIHLVLHTYLWPWCWPNNVTYLYELSLFLKHCHRVLYPVQGVYLQNERLSKIPNTRTMHQ